MVIDKAVLGKRKLPFSKWNMEIYQLVNSRR